MSDLTKISGYTLLKTEDIPDLKGTGYYFKHEKSGAKVAWLKTADENKVFSVAFRTPPEDSTGVAHIIEHTVLCGSERFPAKDPFIELAKGSLNTFLNAMTFSDKTMYPVASCNMQDFKNLMHVYMDAVFYPNIYKREEIFKQEGWHYELESADDDLIYNGIVYSEMKGAFSSPEQVLSRENMNSLFPDTSYGVESGGHPDNIPDLTYENYLDFHRRYYHPVNSYIYLYGEMDIEERLRWMDEEYLSKFDVISLDSSLKCQESFHGIRETQRYYSVEETNGDGGVYYSYNVLAGEAFDLKMGTAFEVLDQVLFSAPGAPVKQALIDAGIGEDYFTSYSGDVLQPYFSVAVKNAKAGQKQLFVDTLRTALKKCVEEGIKQTSLLAAINAQEFRYKEADFGRIPKGLLYGINMMSSWLYDENQPFLYLHANKEYAQLKEEIGTGYFEGLVEKYLLNSDHGSILTLAPKAGMNEEKEAALKEKLAAYKASLSKEEVEKLVADTKALRQYQEEPTSKEDLEKIPMLSISDIEKKAKGFKNEKFLKDIAPEALWHNINTNGINYFRLMFDARGLEVSEVPYCGLLSDILGTIDTKQHGYQELSDLIATYTGGFGTHIMAYELQDDYKAFLPKFVVTMKSLYENTDKAVGFVSEILTETIYTDTKRLQEILLEIKSRLEMRFMSSGNSVAMGRAGSYYGENYAFEEEASGISYYEFVKSVLEQYDTVKDEVAAKLKAVADKLFIKDNYVLSLTADEEGKAVFEKEIKAFLTKLPEGTNDKTLHMPLEKKNEGFKTPGQVQYVVRSGRYKDSGIEFKGSYEVLRTILGYGYLWNEIRVKGGAYGGGITIGTSGANFYSYRDPNLRETNEIYERVLDYLDTFEADEREMTKNILGTMSGIDFPLSPASEGYRSLMAYLIHRTEEQVQKTRDEILSTTAEDIRNTKPMLKAVLDAGYACTVGSAAKVEACKDMFMEVKTLM